ncbi:iron-sulfur cluster biosynthesis family protein [Shouchella patagoniensis]|uniref:iron-sulfur cluster biosynthesis family protein n=1 Tax=Shouchella patagoniensis TaxID=228576 RepID=UPI00111787E0|nr:iron-sulfur cluster biosynthesis family protein [Shouchella patagoniensis]
MQINITEEAANYLKDRNYSTIRVAARDTFECSTMVEFYLQEGVFKEDDQLIKANDLTFLYDNKAEEEIGKVIKVDYVLSQGLKLLAPRGTLAYAQKVKPLDWEPDTRGMC